MWDYHIFNFENGMEELRAMGVQGWQVVGVIRVETDSHYATLLLGRFVP